MRKYFNTAGICVPAKHYMVDLTERVNTIIRDYIEPGKYFAINRGRQYGKTTTLSALRKAMLDDYVVLSISFEVADGMFRSERDLANGFLSLLEQRLRWKQTLPEELVAPLVADISDDHPLDELSRRITSFCANAPKPVVLFIDEVDKSSDNDLFIMFLAMLRNKYLDRENELDTTFQSVILAGLYDVKSLKLKIRPDSEHKYNSPWNIAVDFDIRMAFEPAQIAQMLDDYESDYHTGMDTGALGQEIYDYTSGYPFLVSELCRIMDERLPREGFMDGDRAHIWSHEGLLKAVNELVHEKNTLFDSLAEKLYRYQALNQLLHDIIYCGKLEDFSAVDEQITLAAMFGFIKNVGGKVAVANRVFEMVLMIYYSVQAGRNGISAEKYAGSLYEYTKGGKLNMDMVLERFVAAYSDIFGDKAESFIEDRGREIFLLFLKPIINGAGNFYLESMTRDRTRTDVIVDYGGERFVLELKIWHGEEYNKRGEEQLVTYLDYYRLSKGWMLSFNFNKNKTQGIHEITLGERTVVEAVV